MLTKNDILLLLRRLADVTIVEPTPSFPYHIVQEQRGYSKDPEISQLQAKLSIMLEAASR